MATGATLVLGKLGLEGISPVLFSFYLFLFATPLSAVTMRIGAGRRCYPLRRLPLVLLFAHVGFSGTAIWLFWAGLTRLDPTVAAFLNRTETILIVLFGIALFGERFRPLEGVGAAVAVVGVALMKLPGEGAGVQSAGFWLMLASSLFFAMTECVSKVVVRHVAITVLAFYRNALLALVFGLLALLTEGLELPTDRQAVLILGVALLGPIASRLLYLLALRSLELGKTAIVTQSQPLFAAALALVVIGEVPRSHEWAGGLLILAGCVGMIAARPPRKAVVAGAATLLLLLASCATGPAAVEPTAPPAPSPPPVLRSQLVIGRSVEGRKIVCLALGRGRETVLVLAAIHGNESAGVRLVRRLADHIESHPVLVEGRRVLLVPVANPDGLARGTRTNARRVDLNRNFPARNFRSPRRSPLSEPESRALFDLITRHAPRRVVSVHEPLGCLDHDGPAEGLARSMARECGLPVRKLGSRPGSLGSWVGLELERPIVTVELPRGAGRLSPDELWRRYGRMLLAAVTYAGGIIETARCAAAPRGRTRRCRRPGAPSTPGGGTRARGRTPCGGARG
jgi:protein MpaA